MLDTKIPKAIGMCSLCPSQPKPAVFSIHFWHYRRTVWQTIQNLNDEKHPPSKLTGFNPNYHQPKRQTYATDKCCASLSIA